MISSRPDVLVNTSIFFLIMGFYFLVSENIDITNVIVQKLNEKNIIFKADIN